MSWQQIAAANRYLEGERGTVHKDWGGRLPIALTFPNTYYVGMSSLAVHSLYRLWNAQDDIVCERVFADPGNPPLSLESGAPLDYFPIVAFSVSFELDYFTVVEILRSAGIPPRVAERDDTYPLVIAGGPAVTANPEPLAPLLDAVVIGEVEPVFDRFTSALHALAEGRDAALDALAEVPGIYLPQQSSDTDPPQRIRRQWLQDLDSVPTHSAIFAAETEFGGMGLIEIARGCGRGCRFCLAGYTYRPPRQRSVDTILAQARELLAFEDRLGLVSAAVSDHTDIDRLATELRALGARISVSSMRVDPVSETLLRALAESGTQTLTIAPEAGSERMRQAINKTQTEEDVLRAVELANRYGFAQLKLYFLLGLPGEQDADVQAIVDLSLACAGRFSRQVTVNITPFVPKAHTPFQRLAQTPANEVKRRLSRVERGVRRHGIGVKSESPAWAEIQGTLARGDRRIADALLPVERPSPARWREALGAVGLSLPELLGERPAGDPLPWAFIHTGVRLPPSASSDP